MGKKLKVLFCTDGIFPHAVGGMQRHSRLLIEALAKYEDIELIVLHPHKDIQVFEGLPQIVEIELEPLPGKQNYLRELYAYSKQVAEVAKQYPEHLIYSQGLSVWADVKILGKRTIVNPHGLEPFQSLGWKDRLKTLPYRLIFGRIFKNCAKVVSLGGHLTAILKRAGKADNVVVLPNATNPVSMAKEFLVREKSKPMRFLFVGRFAHNKGIDVLLEACQQLNAEGFQSDYAVDLAGKGPLFEEMLARYPLPNVNFMGFVTDEQLDAAYLDDDVFVLPTLFEGMPTVILEAMARAMPIIVTDTGATLELVDEKNGKIIEKNNISSLKNALKSFLEMPQTTFLMRSASSLEKFEARFTWQAVAEAHRKLFRDR